jgi:hypothetical protein
MRQLYLSGAGVALACSLGLLPGCSPGTPAEPTRQATLAADQKSQDAMRKYYGNMIGKKAKSQAKGSKRAH